MFWFCTQSWRQWVNHGGRLKSPWILSTCHSRIQPALRIFQLIGHPVITGSSGITIPWKWRLALIWCHLFQAGLIRTDNGEFFIEPLERGQQDVEVKGRVHVVYRRSAIKRETGKRREDLHNEGRGAETLHDVTSVEILSAACGRVVCVFWPVCECVGCACVSEYMCVNTLKVLPSLPSGTSYTAVQHTVWLFTSPTGRYVLWKLNVIFRPVFLASLCSQRRVGTFAALTGSSSCRRE